MTEGQKTLSLLYIQGYEIRHVFGLSSRLEANLNHLLGKKCNFVQEDVASKNHELIITIPPEGERAQVQYLLSSRDDLVSYTSERRSESGIGYEETELAHQHSTKRSTRWASN